MLNLKSKKIKANIPEIFTQIKHAFDSADSFKSNQAEDYRNAWMYYDCKLPEKVVENGSGYVEPVLREAVDRILPGQLNIFTSSDQHAVAYRPMGMILGKDGQPLNTTLLAQAVDHKINEIFLRENNGYEMLSDAFTEALVSGSAWTKEYVEERVVEDCVEFEEWIPFPALLPLAQEYPDTDFTVLETKTEEIEQPNPAAMDPLADALTDAPATVKVDVPMVKGKLELVRIERNIKVNHIPFNEVFVDASALTIDDARYLCHRQMFAVGKLIEMGFDESIVIEADSADEASDALSKKRFKVDGTFSDDQANEESQVVDPYERKVYLYEHFIYSSLLEGKTKLYRVFATNNDILEIYPADYIPFQHGKVLSIPGSFIGNSMYNICKGYQDSLSHSQRMALDNMTKQTHGRYYAFKNGYDKRALINWEPNGIVEVNQIGAVTPEVIHSVPPHYESIVGRIADSRDRSVGLQVGNSLDAGSLNNVAAATVSMILGNQDLKDKRIAGTLARTLVRPIFETIYKILREESVDLMLADGNVFNTSDLPKLANFTVDVTTSNDSANLTGILMNMLQLDAQLAAVPNKSLDTRAVLTQVGKNGGLTDDQINQFMPPPPPPTPMDEAAQQMAMETQMEQLELAKATKQRLAVEIAKMEVETSEMIKDGEAERKRAEEESARKFIETETKVKELEMELDIYRKQGNYQNVVVGQ